MFTKKILQKRSIEVNKARAKHMKLFQSNLIKNQQKFIQDEMSKKNSNGILTLNLNP